MQIKPDDWRHLKIMYNLRDSFIFLYYIAIHPISLLRLIKFFCLHCHWFAVFFQLLIMFHRWKNGKEMWSIQLFHQIGGLYKFENNSTRQWFEKWQNQSNDHRLDWGICGLWNESHVKRIVVLIVMCFIGAVGCLMWFTQFENNNIYLFSPVSIGNDRKLFRTKSLVHILDRLESSWTFKIITYLSSCGNNFSLLINHQY